MGLLAMIPTTLAAQQEPEAAPPGPVAVDVRGALARFGHNPELAALRGVGPDQLPGGGLGIDVGAHWYPVRTRRLTIGVGASVLLSSGTGRPPTPEDAARPTGPSVRTSFRALAPQLSLNFGHDRGWSYLSGGLGSSELDVAQQMPAGGAGSPVRRARTLNYGGGARWFARPHLAFTFDVRFYAISPLPEEGPAPAQPRLTLMAVSVGVSLK
jgi:hypothetical protein